MRKNIILFFYPHIYFKRNGDLYEGFWEQDKKNGIGIYTWSKGGYYKG